MNEATTNPSTGKGEYGGICNITACSTKLDWAGGNWWNQIMRKYYCRKHALEINRHSDPNRTELQIWNDWHMCIEIDREGKRPEVNDHL